jgi:hypothetical protein
MRMVVHVALVGVLVLGAGCGSETQIFGAPDAEADVGSTRDSGPARDAEERPELIEPADGSAETGEPPERTIEERAVSIRIVPSSGTYDLAIGTGAAEPLAVYTLLDDGTESPIPGRVRWDTSDDELGDVGDDGLLRLTGTRGGILTMTASWNGLSANGTYDVRLSGVEILDGLTGDVVAGFGAYDAAGSPAGGPAWQYPEDGTLFPAGIVPPVLQWDGGGNTLFRLTLARGDDVRIDVFTTQPRFQPSEAQWDALARGFDEPITLALSARASVEALDTTHAPARSIRTADAELAGDVYYWQVETGDIMRVPEGATAPERVFSTNAETGTCRGCHTLSRDGGRLAFMYNGGDNPRAGLAWTGAPEPAIVENGTETRWTWFAFDPTGTRGLAIHSNRMWLADVSPGLPGGIANLGDVPASAGRALSHPAWSPDGSRVAFVNRNPGNADWSYDWGEILQMAWDPTTSTFGEPVTLVARGPDATNDTMSYPTWTPDSRFVGYLQGPDTRTGENSFLMLADAQTSATVRLERAGPAGIDVFPSFSPYLEGGYYWLLFYSRRPYGHLSSHKQLWVAAVDAHAPPGTDPSFPAFWLPGQDTSRQNITGYWSPPICTNDSACKEDSDCCTGFACVRDEALGDTFCRPSECTLVSQPCTDSTECCAGHECLPNLNGLPVCQLVFE